MSAVVGSFSLPSIPAMHIMSLTMVRVAWWSDMVFEQRVCLVRVGYVSNSELLVVQLLSLSHNYDGTKTCSMAQSQWPGSNESSFVSEL